MPKRISRKKDDSLSKEMGLPFFLGIRHHSPACARMVMHYLREIKPKKILIEGPSNFTPFIRNLDHDHTLPIAIFSYARLKDGTNIRSYYPLSVHSPEWCAIQIGFKLNASIEMIDLPLIQKHEIMLNAPSHQDAGTHQAAILALCKQHHVDHLDEVWDCVLEQDDTLSPETIKTRTHDLGESLRFLDEKNQVVPVLDLERERYMTQRIRAAMQEVSPPEIVVISGAYHVCAILKSLQTKIPISQPAESICTAFCERQEITLIPFSESRLNKLSGYTSGMPHPGYYRHVWENEAHRANPNLAILRTFSSEARQRGIPLSTADLIQIETTSQALAQLRGQRVPWRKELLDAAKTVFIKDEDESSHAEYQALIQILEGQRFGKIETQLAPPPLVAELKALLQKLRIKPSAKGVKEIDLNLLESKERTRSHVLHQLRTLKIPGFELVNSEDDLILHNDFEENWDLSLHRDFESSLYEASIYGENLFTASSALLEESIQSTDEFGKLAQCVLNAIRAGFFQMSTSLMNRLESRVLSCGDVSSLHRTLVILLHFSQWREVYTEIDFSIIESLQKHVWQRLLEILSAGAPIPPNLDAQIVQTMLETMFQWKDRSSPRDSLIVTLSNIPSLGRSRPGLQGAIAGALWTLQPQVTPELTSSLKALLSPSAWGEFLIGLLKIAKEFLLNHPSILAFLHSTLSEWSEEQFLSALPRWHEAFHPFSAQEKRRIIHRLPHSHDSLGHFPNQNFSPDSRQSSHDLESQLLKILDTYQLNFLEDASLPKETDDSPPLEPIPPLSNFDSHHAVFEETPEIRRLTCQRWRLILGAEVEDLIPLESDPRARRVEQTIQWLYDRSIRNSPSKHRSPSFSFLDSRAESHLLSFPEWIQEVHALFPPSSIDILEKDALEKFHLTEIFTQKDFIEKLQPSVELARVLLASKHLIPQELHGKIKKIVQRTLKQILQKLTPPLQTALQGKRPSILSSPHANFRDFDPKTTIRKNLKFYDPQSRQLIIQKPWFKEKKRTHAFGWKLIVMVDQSGSMNPHVLHSAAMASIFHGLPTLKTHFGVFDTRFYDLTSHLDTPDEILMGLQLGGETHLGNSLIEASSLIENPHKTIMVILSDFYETDSVSTLMTQARRLIQQGTRILGLPSLNPEGDAHFNRELAHRLVQEGAHIAALSPQHVAEWIASIIR